MGCFQGSWDAILLPPTTAQNLPTKHSGVILASSLEDSRPSPSLAVGENHAALGEESSPEDTNQQAAAEL